LGLPGAEAVQQQQQRCLFRPYQPKTPLNLLAKGRADGLPLQRLSVEGDLVDMCARLTITQVFFNDAAAAPADNDETGGLECVYTFPVEELATGVATYSCPLVVCGVEVEIGDTRVVAEVQPKQEAIATYGSTTVPPLYLKTACVWLTLWALSWALLLQMTPSAAGTAPISWKR
jgi:hypothetical protein